MAQVPPRMGLHFRKFISNNASAFKMNLLSVQQPCYSFMLFKVRENGIDVNEKISSYR